MEKGKAALKQTFEQVYHAHQSDPHYIPPPIPPSSHITPLYIEDEQEMDHDSVPSSLPGIYPPVM